MKKLFIIALACVFFSSCADRGNLMTQATKDQATAKIAELLELPQDSIEVDWESMELYDNHWGEKLLFKKESYFTTEKVKEKRTGKSILLEMNGVVCESARFAPEGEN
jgi:cytochrome b involved in lipid metabolism